MEPHIHENHTNRITFSPLYPSKIKYDIIMGPSTLENDKVYDQFVSEVI